MKHLYQTDGNERWNPLNYVKTFLSNNMPVGYSWKQEAEVNIAGLVFSIFYAVAIFQMNFQANLDASGIGEEGIINLNGNFTMPSFRANVGTGMYMFLIFMIGQLIWIGIHYYYHYAGLSKCIYIMRRIPDRLELHRRCILLPMLTVFVYLMAAVLVLWMNYRTYAEIIPVTLLQ